VLLTAQLRSPEGELTMKMPLYPAWAPVLVSAADDVSAVVRHDGVGDVVALSSDAVTVLATATCTSVEDLFRGDVYLSSVAVLDGARVGLLPRSQLGHVMAGRMGYGALLNGRRQVAEVTNWSPLLVDASRRRRRCGR
jgi:hypothetical protein